MSYQERALAIIDRLTDSKAINIRERGTLRRAILLPERPQGDIRWTDKLSATSNGDIIDFEGRVVGHINLEDMKAVRNEID